MKKQLISPAIYEIDLGLEGIRYSEKSINGMPVSSDVVQGLLEKLEQMELNFNLACDAAAKEAIDDYYASGMGLPLEEEK